MSEEERIKTMATFRASLEKRIRDLETELDGMRVLLQYVNEVLLAGGFKRATLVTPSTSTPYPPKIMDSPAQTEIIPQSPSSDLEPPTPLKTITGHLLAHLYVHEGSMRVVPTEEREFNVHTPPFTTFLVDRVLSKMKEKDEQAAMSGQLSPNNALTYHIQQEEDVIREITITNIVPERIPELKSTIRWTLEKMFEKETQLDQSPV